MAEESPSELRSPKNCQMGPSVSPAKQSSHTGIQILSCRDVESHVRGVGRRDAGVGGAGVLEALAGAHIRVALALVPTAHSGSINPPTPQLSCWFWRVCPLLNSESSGRGVPRSRGRAPGCRGGVRGRARDLPRRADTRCPCPCSQRVQRRSYPPQFWRKARRDAAQAGGCPASRRTFSRHCASGSLIVFPSRAIGLEADSTTTFVPTGTRL